MTSATIFVPNAIVFLLDPSNKEAIIPAYIPGKPTSFNPTCISIVTLADVDGDATFYLAQPLTAAEKSGYMEVYDGSLDTPGRKLAIVTSQLDVILESTVPGHITRVRVSVNEADAPSVIYVEFE